MHTSKSIKDKKKKSYRFSIQKTQKKNQKYVLACILALITSLLEPWELGQYFKNSKKKNCFLLISGIMNFTRKMYSRY
jgi:hypothetical protein